jgi:hypothetical protein
MIPLAQFDPATLSIWTTVSLLGSTLGEHARVVMQAAVRGEDPDKLLSALSQNDPQRRRLLWLSSSVWHEKRHFFDTCLTNYGAKRFRDLFTLAANFIQVAKRESSRGQPIWFPVELYANKVRRGILGVAEPSSDVLDVARIARNLKTLSTQLDAPLYSNSGTIQIGAEAQMEGLAQASQTASIEHFWGIEQAFIYTLDQVHLQHPFGPYRAIERLSFATGCFSETSFGAITLNTSLAAALFVTALCGRFFGTGRELDPNLVAPLNRLGCLIEELGPSPGHYHMSGEEAWDLVDSAARRKWGRGAIEEIAADIDAAEAKFATIESFSDNTFPDAFADFIGLRRRLLAAVQEAGPASVLPRVFASRWVNRLLPWHVDAVPGGAVGPDKEKVLFGVKFNPPPPPGVPECVDWAYFHIPSPESKNKGFSLLRDDPWKAMLVSYAPAARLMLNGRRHRLMVPPELEGVIAELKTLNIDARFDPQFEWPPQRSDIIRKEEALELAKISDRVRFVCDITGDEIEPDHAAVLTSWELRRSPLVQKFLEKAGVQGDILLKFDWSEWIVRSDLLS